MSDNLASFITVFGQWAKTQDITPIVFLIPGNLYRGGGEAQWIEKNRARLPANLIVKAVDTTMLDASRYNVMENGRCHDSPYGAWHIARAYSKELEKHILPLRKLLYGLPVSKEQANWPYYPYTRVRK